MKRRISLSLLFTMLFALALPAAFAKPAASFRIRAEIDFDFYVGSKRLPKGDYNIESVNESGLVRISNAKSGKTVNVLTVRGKLSNKPKSKLQFRRYGEQYFLRKIWDGQNDILELDRSKAEKKAAKALKGNENDEGDEVDKG
ncbi:MAG: hypothetical protein HOP19_15540 [Acidobacteria bacterium]|nr:hypothetical protein [Acidobacteriota bacterium]